MMQNITFDELTIGQSATLSRKLTQNDIDLFAVVSGDVNPAHMNVEFANQSFFHGVIGHGMWTGALISTVLGTVLPGPGTIYLEQDMHFKRPVRIGDTITVRLTVKSKRADKHIVLFDCNCQNEKGEVIVEGTATVLAPTERISVPRPSLPAIEIVATDHYQKILDGAKALGRIRVAVVHPVQANAIQAVAEAYEQGLIDPVLIGPTARIHEAAAENKTDISAWELIDTEHSHAAAAKAVELATLGKVDAIMKGSLHTDELLGAVVQSGTGLRTERRMSHAYIIDTPIYHKPLIITDAAINIAPTLEEKADICRNAIGLWHSLFGHSKKPKVALLSAVETVTTRMPSTIDAAALCKMADRGQITNAWLDGPLAYDNIISKQAAIDKGITSEVAGDADIIVVPNIESGNALAKQLTFLGHANAAGIVLGARVPIILTSRADSLRTRLLSCVVALYLVHARREGKIK
ncbi:MAG: bifunctional enoyl-CoA hydratase/phosphate acetyltransferase [Alphaproteobacteria bacterium]|nr:bifunctional enoyl-CoA hydratase/phosphate acetyltransferase [Alphaproteobacteria bacterium]